MAGTVTVACKLPHGLILRVFDMVEVREPMLGGGYRMVPFAMPLEEQVIINGYVAPFGMSPKAPVLGGFALTHGVDADFFARWMTENKDSDMVKRGLIFAAEKTSMVEGTARERESLKNGMEPLDPDNQRPEFRKIEKSQAA